MWRDLEPVGRDRRTGGYVRWPFASAERECAAWYAEEAVRRGLELQYDGQGNAVAWWRPHGEAETAPAQRGAAILVGSHLDSVDLGGAFDGPLGVVSSFAAIDRLRDRGFIPSRSVGVAMFVEEEGSRFGIACLGSRLATGRIEPAEAAQLRDRDGVFLPDAMTAAGLEPHLGPSPLLDTVGCFVELHVEQGRDLVDRDRPVAVASASWAHGRWRFDFSGEPNHAGATRMDDRHDPMLTYAMTALAANKQARLVDARATFGRLAVEPNNTNAIPARVQAWLDARGADARLVDELVETITRQATERAGRDGTAVVVTAESVAPTVDFDQPLAHRLAAVLDDAPTIPTGAGHDAGILQLAGIPSAMLFVRNPTGVSHSPAEYAELADCLAGVDALVTVLAELAA
ncbi:MAG: allantoate amidohydrolase [Propionibacteriales bacterium]|nr:allantoate amidohydrolase [Propionibacteriales bacterium]